MKGGGRQGDLFAGNGLPEPGTALAATPPPLLREQLLAWQQRLAAHQGPLFGRGGGPGGGAAAGELQQGQLFASSAPAGHGPSHGPSPGGEPGEPGDPVQQAARLDPLGLRAQSLSFWRWPHAPHQGAAIYLVMDRPPEPSPPLLLYVGETGRADLRWKGEHDCKGYLAAYGESLQRAGMEARLSIRFWGDVPATIRPRRALEQALIRRWLPPFNKETRQRWVTPFTADPA
jgi:hypothetical protein